MSNTQSSRARGARTRVSRRPKHEAEPANEAGETLPRPGTPAEAEVDIGEGAKPHRASGSGAPTRRRRPVVKKQVAEEARMARLTPQQWRSMVAEAAYFRAEHRGFVGGSQEQDWYAAEEEIRRGLEER